MQEGGAPLTKPVLRAKMQACGWLVVDRVGVRCFIY